MKNRIRIPITHVVLIAFATFSLNACVHVEAGTKVTQGEKGTTGVVAVKIYENPTDRKGGVLTARRIVTDLLRKENGNWVPVHHATEAAYTLSDLPPARYDLRVTGTLDEDGKLQQLTNTENETFTLEAGELATVDVTLKRFPFWAVGGPALGIGIAVIVVAVVTSLIFSFSSSDGSRVEPRDQGKAARPDHVLRKSPTSRP